MQLIIPVPTCVLILHKPSGSHKVLFQNFIGPTKFFKTSIRIHILSSLRRSLLSQRERYRINVRNFLKKKVPVKARKQLWQFKVKTSASGERASASSLPTSSLNQRLINPFFFLPPPWWIYTQRVEKKKSHPPVTHRYAREAATAAGKIIPNGCSRQRQPDGQQTVSSFIPRRVASQAGLFLWLKLV